MSTSRWISSAASFSWIDPKTGLPEVDKGGDPGDGIHRDEVFAGAKYRFANYLEAVVDIDDKLGIVKAVAGEASGMYRGPSFLRLDSAPVGRIGRSVSYTRQQARFRQLVGCRTESPERIGAGAGAVIGAGAAVAGVAAGAKLGALAGVWAGPPGMFIGAVALGTVGYFAGREVAEFASAFPPIWTELEIVIGADRSVRCSLISHSLFPSLSFYGADCALTEGAPATRLRRQAYAHDGDDAHLKAWKARGWGSTAAERHGATPGNPWGMADPGPVVGRPKPLRELPLGYDGDGR